MQIKKKVSTIIVVNENSEILVLKRAPGNRSFADYWNFPGGGVEPNETIETAAVRELQEEAGLVVSEKDLTYFEVSSLPKLIVHHFMTNRFQGEVEINWESTEFRWVSIEEIKTLKFIPISPNMLNDIKYYMESLYE